MKSFAFIDNPLVVYVDNDEDYELRLYTFDRFVNTSIKIELASFSWNVPGCGLFRRSTNNECKASQATKVIIVSIKAPQTIH